MFFCGFDRWTVNLLLDGPVYFQKRKKIAKQHESEEATVRRSTVEHMEQKTSPKAPPPPSQSIYY